MLLKKHADITSTAMHQVIQKTAAFDWHFSDTLSSKNAVE